MREIARVLRIKAGWGDAEIVSPEWGKSRAARVTVTAGILEELRPF